MALLDKKGQKSKQQPRSECVIEIYNNKSFIVHCFRFVKQDQVCIADLEAAGIICIEEFSEFPSMGRFTLRDEGKALHTFNHFSVWPLHVNDCVVLQDEPLLLGKF